MAGTVAGAADGPTRIRASRSISILLAWYQWQRRSRDLALPRQINNGFHERATLQPGATVSGRGGPEHACARSQTNTDIHWLQADVQCHTFRHGAFRIINWQLGMTVLDNFVVAYLVVPATRAYEAVLRRRNLLSTITPAPRSGKLAGTGTAGSTSTSRSLNAKRVGGSALELTATLLTMSPVAKSRTIWLAEPLKN